MDCRSRPRRRHLRLRGRHFDGDFLDGGKAVTIYLLAFLAIAFMLLWLYEYNRADRAEARYWSLVDDIMERSEQTSLAMAPINQGGLYHD